MKKMNLILSSLTLIGLLSFVGCEKNENSTNSSTKISDTTSTEKHKVTFVLNNGEDNIVRDVTHGKYASEPLKITKNNHLVDAWYTDEACEKEVWNFKVDKVTTDITLYAKWKVDYERWAWQLGRVGSKSTIMLYVSFFKNQTSWEQDVNNENSFSAGWGSGVVIAKEKDESNNEYYYALTNNHVVTYEDEETETMINYPRKVKIFDHYKNEYWAEVLATENTYDLAVVKFSTTPFKISSETGGNMIYPSDPSKNPNYNEDYAIKVTKFAAEDPKVGAAVSSYGSPIAQQGVCTLGKVFDYGLGCIRENPNGCSYVHEFEVIYHSASILEGNSGGPLFDVDLNLAGINYGSSGFSDTFTSSGDFQYGNFWAIPISRVREFIDKYIVDVYGADSHYAEVLGDL